MKKIKTYNSGTELFYDTWRHGTIKQKEKLLEARGLHKSWAKTKTPDEMIKRGGGLAVKSMGKLFDEYSKRNPNVRIKWNK